MTTQPPLCRSTDVTQRDHHERTALRILLEVAILLPTAAFGFVMVFLLTGYHRFLGLAIVLVVALREIVLIGQANKLPRR